MHSKYRNFTIQILHFAYARDPYRPHIVLHLFQPMMTIIIAINICSYGSGIRNVKRRAHNSQSRQMYSLHTALKTKNLKLLNQTNKEIVENVKNYSYKTTRAFTHINRIHTHTHTHTPRQHNDLAKAKSTNKRMHLANTYHMHISFYSSCLHVFYV